jgi:hypothetical protein
MVMCDHPEMDRRYFVADIDDDRPNGGSVHFQIYRGGMGTTVKTMNKRGSRRSVPFSCGACTLYVELQETSLPDLLDKIAPHRDELFPAGHERRYVIPLKTLCDITRELRARGKRRQ